MHCEMHQKRMEKPYVPFARIFSYPRLRLQKINYRKRTLREIQTRSYQYCIGLSYFVAICNNCVSFSFFLFFFSHFSYL